MRVFVPSPLALAILSLATLVSGPAFAQSAEQPDEVTVRGVRTVTQVRLELERQRDEVFRIFNTSNSGNATDIRCKDEAPTGSRTRRNVCRSEAENSADATAARDFLTSLFASSGSFITNTRGGGPPPPTGGPQVNSAVGTGVAQGDGKAGGADAMQRFEEEWKRVMGENRELYAAVVKYIELQDEYALARGVAPEPEDLKVSLNAPARPAAPVCEATTLTEYFQRNTNAHVEGKISIANCPAGTTGNYSVVARVKNDAGEITPIEFAETWQRDDAQDVAFAADYPIGDVELVSVRVRGLKCSCSEAAQTPP
jgi:hypothetical protein